jgi:hypothetical protein
MDFRDLQLWANEAKKVRLIREADAINAARYGQAEHDAYQEKMTQIEWGLRLLESDEEDPHE